MPDSVVVPSRWSTAQFELIGATRDLLDERHLRLAIDPAGNQAVQFREHTG